MLVEGKARIIEAARRVISRSGISGATMRGIADEAGMSTGAIYHYYKKKEEILYDIMDESLSESTRIANESKLGMLNREAIIEEISKNIIKRFNKDSENRLQFYLAHEAMRGDKELELKFKEKYKEWIGRTEELIQVLYGNKTTKYDKALATLLIGAIDGVVMQMLLHANPAETDDIGKVYYEVLKEGIPKFLDHLFKVQ